MKYDNRKPLDESLKKIDTDIIWNKERQQRTRRRLLSGLEDERVASVSWLKKGIVPLLALLLLFGVVTTFILSEFGGRESAIEEKSISEHDMSGGNGDENAHVILEKEDSDKKAEKDTEEDREEAENKENVRDDEADQSVSDDNEKNDVESQDKEDRTLTQAEVIQAVKGQMNTSLPLKLPKSFSLEEGKHLTAVTKSEADNYQVIFYQSDQPIPINNKKLLNDGNPADVVARIHVEKYDSQAAADEAIAFEDFGEQGGEEVDLGYDLIGYQNAGAGSIWTSWNEGRWALALATHAYTDDNDKGVSLAKEAVAYLEEHALPIPKRHGFAHLDGEKSDNRILWEEQTTVYTIDRVKDPLKALEIAVNFE